MYLKIYYTLHFKNLAKIKYLMFIQNVFNSLNILELIFRRKKMLIFYCG